MIPPAHLDKGGADRRGYLTIFNSQLSVVSRGIKMSGIKLEDIREITKNPQEKGYLIILALR
ncbi:unknown protein [Microcystis aeruginosa NIES-843]|uniref:Uncharacterized protein n=1 Tax=Microcystis aeruginosa (strain NIES-843 / IAM M-2473) TaxID=449447 RepID=B0JMK6_MICAN|nr:unknown protein [Microcystis aeruginosa NIES-843]